MKSLVLREKEDKFASEFGTDEKVMSLISSLQDPGSFMVCELAENITFLEKRCLNFSLHYPLMIYHFRCNLCKIFAEGHFPGRKADSSLEASTNITSLPKDIHGAPAERFIVKLAEAIGSLKTLQKMALFWFRVVEEVNLLE